MITVDINYMIKYNIYMTNFLLNRVAFTIFGVDIYWYGVIISTAIVIAFLLSFALCKRKGHPSSIPYEIIIAILPLGILSARLFDVLFDSGLSITDYFKFRDFQAPQRRYY